MKIFLQTIIRINIDIYLFNLGVCKVVPLKWHFTLLDIHKLMVLHSTFSILCVEISAKQLKAHAHVHMALIKMVSSLRCQHTHNIQQYVHNKIHYTNIKILWYWVQVLHTVHKHMANASDQYCTFCSTGKTTHDVLGSSKFYWYSSSH